MAVGKLDTKETAMVGAAEHDEGLSSAGGARSRRSADEIAGDIRERIATGVLRPGDLIPSEPTIVAEWGVAKMTASRALARLRSAGLVEVLPGRGAIVRERRAAVSPAAQLERMRTTGRIRLPNEHTVIVETGEMDSARVDPAIVAALEQTSQSGPMLYRRRVVHRDGQPMCVATSWVGGTVLSPQRGWRDARARFLDYATIPEGTPRLIADLVGEDPAHEDYRASAEVASTIEATALGVHPGAPVMRVITTVSGATWPLECGVYTYPAGTPVDFPSVKHSM